MKINNRRYIGCKTKLLNNIYNAVQELGYTNENVFADIFAGTGVVAYKFAENGYKTILNDTLKSNIVAYDTWLGSGELDIEKVNSKIDEFNELPYDSIEENYFSDIYAGKYFSINDAKKIGFIRESIANDTTLTDREKSYLITSLMYATDKIANTVGHFESFLRKEPIDKNIKLSKLEVDDTITKAEIYCEDANKLVENIKTDIAYIDPPYNARQYVNFYHVLENLVRWNKPTEFEGNSMKFKRKELKSDYCRNKAPKLLEDLVNKLDCKLIVISYNNTYTAKSTSSNNMIQAEDIIRILEKKGKVTIKEIDHKFFNAGKTDFSEHKELLYICEVAK